MILGDMRIFYNSQDIVSYRITIGIQGGEFFRRGW